MLNADCADGTYQRNGSHRQIRYGGHRSYVYGVGGANVSWPAAVTFAVRLAETAAEAESAEAAAFEGPLVVFADGEAAQAAVECADEVTAYEGQF